MARRHARRAAHQRVGAVAHAAAGFGRRGRVARVVLARPPATGEGTVGAAREPRLPCVCRTKHTIRVRDFGCVPALRHLVECVSVVEHVPHGRDRADVPPRYVRVELPLAIEQAAHVRHHRHVPVRHLDWPGGAAVRAVVAARHAGGIDGETAVHRGLECGSVGKRARGVAGVRIISSGSGPAVGIARHVGARCAQSVLDAIVLRARR
mmetsp:Transcript_7277/g.32041  ORF Transcript_7277/g.32041 Transcript_7277/m.32041 type:complete len:208 (+) Transcript_7277:635-1258(+)